MKNTACAVLMVILLANPLTAQDPRHGGGETPKNVCIQPQEYKLIQETQIRIEPQLRGATAAVMFQDPMADGTNSSGKTVVNYVDLDPTSGLKDYNCGTVTYNGHNGVDIEILDFYEMDEGIPVLCSAPGTVTFVRDGEDDRNTVWVTGTLANTVVVTHADGSQAYYLHFRKGSLRVPLNQTVSAGDTLGLVGSSGFSSGPHLHFEVRVSGVVKDPFQGTCQPDASLWQNQGAYVLSLPFALMNHGLTTIPLSGQTAWAMISERPPSKTHVTAGTTIYSWIRLRNVLSSDVLTWKFYANNSLWNEYSFSPSDTYSSSWWYIYWNLPASGTLYGNWKIEIYRNGALIAEQP
ncbi:MAG: M23 family metallopeptidase, partial [Bacteroidota bacterium]